MASDPLDLSGTDNDFSATDGYLERIFEGLNKAFLVVGCLFIAIMMLHVTVDVALRFLFNSSVIGTLETVSYYHMVIAVFLPFGYVELKGEHIRVDLFVQFLPKPVQFALYLFACLLGLAYFGMLGYQSFLDAWRSTDRMETIMSNFLFYIWPSRWALPLGFAGICFAILANLVRALRLRRAL